MGRRGLKSTRISLARSMIMAVTHLTPCVQSKDTVAPPSQESVPQEDSIHRTPSRSHSTCTRKSPSSSGHCTLGLQTPCAARCRSCSIRRTSYTSQINRSSEQAEVRREGSTHCPQSFTRSMQMSQVSPGGVGCVVFEGWHPPINFPSLFFLNSQETF